MLPRHDVPALSALERLQGTEPVDLDGGMGAKIREMSRTSREQGGRHGKMHGKVCGVLIP